MNEMKAPTSSTPGGNGHRQRWATTLLTPGIRLMRSLRMTTKLLLVSLSLLVPLVVLMAWSLGRQLVTLQHGHTELAGIAVQVHLLPVLVEVQKHRGLTRRVQAGDGTATAPRDEARRALAANVASLDKLLLATPQFTLEDAWRPLRARLLQLAEGRHAPEGAAAFDEHTQAIETLRQLALLNGERAALVVDPAPRGYFLVDVLVNAMFPMMESAGLGRGLGAGLLARGSVTPIERAEVLGHAGLLARAVADVDGKFAAFVRAGGVTPGSWPSTRSALLAFSASMRQSFAADQINGDPKAFFEAGTAAIAQVIALNRDSTVRLSDEIQARIAITQRDIALTVGAFLAGLGALTYLMVTFYLSLKGSLRVLQRSTDAVADGDLSQPVRVLGRDEVAEMGRTIDTMGQRLSALVADIRSNATQLGMAGTQLADGGARLAQRTDDQACSLRSSVDAVAELSQAVAGNAESARELDALTEKLYARSQDAGSTMSETVGAMQALQASSQRVAEVVTVIDDLAFQTGMLALNASIEAARAGELGKGFAVVAGEVRQLAQRSAESAEEIRSLIMGVNEQVEHSSGKLGHASQVMAEIIEGVQEVAGRLSRISAASTQQSTVLAEVSAGIGALDEITRENAAMVEESATASSSLLQRADMLRASVASMRLRQGSADEARELVERACAHIAQVGREQALADFHREDSGFVDRDLYIFCFDRYGVYSAFGAKPQYVGKSLKDVPGLDPESFLRDVWAAADGGGGWVQYDVMNPRTDVVAGKESWVVPLGDDQVLGCGFYRIDGADAPIRAIPRANAWVAPTRQVLASTVG
jgi:methyl-accepting chemotaxis protein